MRAFRAGEKTPRASLPKRILGAVVGVEDFVGYGPRDHRLAYRVGGALMLVSAALVLGRTFALDAVGHPHGWHRHAIVYTICTVAAVVGVWLMSRRQRLVEAAVRCTPILIALSCAPLLLVATLPAALAGVLITLTQRAEVFPYSPDESSTRRGFRARNREPRRSVFPRRTQRRGDSDARIRRPAQLTTRSRR